MALTDINFQEGDFQNFILEVPSGNVNFRPSDILIEGDGSLACLETPIVTSDGGGDNIFIMSE